MADVKNYAVNSTSKLEEQVKALAESEAYKDSVIRVMPDGHPGKGAVVGSTITYNDKVVPNTVGVDVACRVTLFKIPSDVNFARLDKALHAKVPVGFSVRNTEAEASQELDYSKLTFWNALSDDKQNRIRLSLGSLGGGNHMIAVDEGHDGQKYLLVHCGSRSLGTEAATWHQNIANSEMTKRRDAAERLDEIKADAIRATGKFSELEGLYRSRKYRLAKYDNSDLDYLEGNSLADYLQDMLFIEEWSYLNHMTIYREVAKEMGWSLEPADMLTCAHNYVDVASGIIRKGAISARKDELGIIPLNMRDGTLVVLGKGNPDWNYSLPHGAGRQMSRTEARQNIALEQYEDAMRDVYSSTVNLGSLDEAPMAYKPAQSIIKAIEPNAIMLDHLREVFNFKDDSSK